METMQTCTASKELPNDVERAGWTKDAACKNHDPELFFPVGTDGPAIIQTIMAKRICNECPVILQCRTYAHKTGQQFGIWGGETEDARRRWRRGRLNR